MFLKRIAPTYIFSLLCYVVSAQVPVIKEPRSYQFENYSNSIVKTTPSSSSTNLGTSFNSQANYTQSVHPQVNNPSTCIIEKYNIPPPGVSAQVLRRYADEDIKRHELEIEQRQVQVDEANAIFDELHIQYELPFEELPEKKNYAIAFEELMKMLKGEKPLSIERAVFLSEYAFDPTLNFAEFDGQLNKSANVIRLKMEKDRISPSDNLGKIMTTFKFMADTISVSTKGETNITSYPKTYDFEDFWGRRDYRKMFVSKLVKTNSGQCHSLPLLFLILCEKIGAEAHLAFAPNHSFIKFQDKRGKWHNIELTNGMLASDHFMIESGFIKAEALQSKIYLEPLTKKQVIVQCLNDLALGYQKKYGYDPFVKECVNVALSYDSKSLTARQTFANYYINLSNYIAYQYKEKGFSKSQFDQDGQAQTIITSTDKAIQDIENLGYADMPPEAYEAWLKSIQKESCKQQHSNEVRILGGMIELKK